MLRQLVEYAARLDLPPPLYSETPIRYVIQLDSAGRLLSQQPLDTADGSNRATQRGVRRRAPQVKRANVIRPFVLADQSEYTFGLPRPDSKGDRPQKCHAAYLDIVRRCAAASGDASVEAVYQFLTGNPLDQIDLPENFNRSETLTFQVEGTFVIDLPAVQRFWAAVNDPAVKDAPIMQCIVCGQHRPVLRRLQGNLKGIPRGNTTGTSIISANEVAFESYGLDASLIAPTCSACAQAFTNSVNDLLARRESRIVLGNAAFIFWTREDVGFSLFPYVDDPQPAQVRALLESVRTGGLRPDVDNTAFYAAVLSANNARAVVREWIDQTVGDAKASLSTWFEDQAMVDRDGSEIRPLGLRPLAAATVRDPSKELAPPTIRALLRAALTETPAPFDLLARAVRRNRAEGTVTQPRAALIKLVLARQGMSREEVRQMTQLTPDHPNPAYHCGRLLAVLDAVQRAALGTVNATIVDRYFGTASSAPGTVFPYLIRGSAPHLAKLRKTRPGVYQALQQRMEDVMDRLPDFRSVLTLEEQGLFALGYYHQRADDRRRAAERRNAAASSIEPSADAGGPTDEEPAS